MTKAIGWRAVVFVITHLALGLFGIPFLVTTSANQFTIPWDLDHFVPEEGCQWQPLFPEVDGLLYNAHYLAGPRPGQTWEDWLLRIRAYRDAIRAHTRDASSFGIVLRFDGVRAWVRVNRRWAWAVNLSPGETICFHGEARWLDGNSTLCLALDWCDRSGGADGVWRGWSTVVASCSIPQDSAWHPFEITATIPPFDSVNCWARPILGMDGTFDRRPGSLVLRNLTLSLPDTPERSQQRVGLSAEVTKPKGIGIDDSIYRRPDLSWMTRNFVCGFIMIYDRAFWDPERLEYRTAGLCDEAEREFGGFDSVVLWQPITGSEPTGETSSISFATCPAD